MSAVASAFKDEKAGDIRTGLVAGLDPIVAGGISHTQRRKRREKARAKESASFASKQEQDRADVVKEEAKTRRGRLLAMQDAPSVLSPANTARRKLTA